jgi:hypothetical protein
MLNEALGQFTAFTSATLATAIALALAAVVLLAIRNYWTGPVDPLSLLEGLLALGRKKKPRIEYRDAVGAFMDLGPLVGGALQTIDNSSLALVDGHFVGAAGAKVAVGARCTINVAGNCIVESVRVRVDPARGALYVTSKYTKGEALEQINGYGTPAAP